MDVSQFIIHSPVDGHVGYFHFGTITDTATEMCKALYEHRLSFLLGKYLGVQWLIIW